MPNTSSRTLKVRLDFLRVNRLIIRTTETTDRYRLCFKISIQTIVSFGVNVKPLALSPLSFFHWSNRMEEPTLLIEKSRGRFPGGVVYLSHVVHIMGMGFHSVPQRHELHLVFLLLQSRSDWKSNSKRYMWVHGPRSPPDRCHLKLNFYRMISFIDHDRINYLIITYFRETSFSRFKNFRKIKVPRKLKTRNLVIYIKTFI